MIMNKSTGVEVSIILSRHFPVLSTVVRRIFVAGEGLHVDEAECAADFCSG